MTIVQKHTFDKNYFKTVYPKKQIYLHHTVSSTAKSTIDWWNKDANPIGTAYVIDRDGTIIEFFEPQYWAYHLGLPYGLSKGFADKKSIGIEIVNKGPVTRKEVSPGKFKYFWFDGKAEYKEEPVKLKTPWRGYSYFDPYTDAQYLAVKELVSKLCLDFKIPKLFTNNFNFEKNYAISWEGVLLHCNVRSDKTDISPAFNLQRIQ